LGNHPTILNEARFYGYLWFGGMIDIQDLVAVRLLTDKDH
jgi:hypothetical protein